uniref:Uncharacterized protein n=1 Tax=Anguilla anguilla TaxID=7936 RepID=A0A0E9SIR5_ANGAN
MSLFPLFLKRHNSSLTFIGTTPVLLLTNARIKIRY